ncbi:MAG: hypothetical protein RI580_08560 [Halothece sp. Uz-M2-17]|nr:hypothetical protein [Halothece sp. Uz-M2-17]
MIFTSMRDRAPLSIPTNVCFRPNQNKAQSCFYLVCTLIIDWTIVQKVVSFLTDGILLRFQRLIERTSFFLPARSRNKQFLMLYTVFVNN